MIFIAYVSTQQLSLSNKKFLIQLKILIAHEHK